MVSGIGGMAALSGGIGGIVAALWRHGGMVSGIGGMAGGIVAALWRHTMPPAALFGGMAAWRHCLAALAALWRHCWRHCGGMAALLTFSPPVLHLSLCCPSVLVTRDARYAAELGAVRMPKARL